MVGSGRRRGAVKEMTPRPPILGSVLGGNRSDLARFYNWEGRLLGGVWTPGHRAKAALQEIV